jgi:hypothetical protein
MMPRPPFLALTCVLALAAAAPALGETAAGAPRDLPKPGIGVFFKAEDVPRLREKIQRPPCRELYEKMLKQADAAMAKWPDDKAQLRISDLAPKLPDLTMEQVPAEFAPEGGKQAGLALDKYATEGAPCAALAYLMTGDRRYAAFAWDVFGECAKVNRWGWFPWAGSHVPQIHFGIVSRNLVLVADCVWDTLTPEDRRRAREAIAEKCVEPYFRLVLQTPGMGLYHMRSRNQGNNALAAALVGSLFVGDALPDNRIWQASLIQTCHWAITHDIGWMGQGLESGMPGYWSVSMQNLYTAAAALANVRGIDLRAHPGFEQATWYPVIHETTVPPVGNFKDPIDPAWKGPAGILSGKPIELPHGASCAAWWFDYAARFPESPALYFAAKEMIRPERLRASDAHQAALANVLAMAWWDDRLLAEPKAPRSLAQFTDRMAGLRSAYGNGATYLYFNGDLFLSARNEILCTTSGMSWHFPWHQYQEAETGVETEDELFAPSMILGETSDDARFAYFRAASGFSNVAYYARPGQRESHKHYQKRDRSVLYVRPSDGAADYFVFADDVRHVDPKPRWHAWTWHLWDAVANPKNSGRFVAQGDRAVRAERPNADLWIQFLAPAKVAIEEHGVPAQPHVSYEMDHNGRMMRAIAGGYEPADAKAVTIPPAAWQGLGTVQDGSLYMEKPPTEQNFKTSVVQGLVGGTRYRLSLECKEQNYRVYEATAWEVGLELLDRAGSVVASPTTPYGHPHPLKLGAPRSDMKTHDWTETVQYFDAPPEAVACRATFRAVGGAHYFELGSLWLRPVQLQPVGKPVRAAEQRFVTLVMPLEKGAPPPKIETAGDGRTVVTHAGGAVDEIAVAPDGRPTLVRQKGGAAIARFAGAAKAEGAAAALATNSEENARLLRAGLKPLLDEIAGERDALTAKGRKNLALGAKVTASATRDERFAASHVIDNQAAEYPLDGHLDYTLGITWSSNRTAGYGAGKDSLLDNRDYFPLYVRPTWWLLPEETLGHVEIELREAATVDLVRLLNTSNAGLNDFAAHTFRVELYDAEHKLLAKKDDAFGKVFDRPFKQAFFVPKWFSHYTPTFSGMLEPGLTVPFGDGWREVKFDKTKGVRSVRVVITKYWGIGGGLNEVQVYGE